MFCRNCGKQLSDTAMFCPGCGTKVGAAPAPEADKKVETPEPEKAAAPEAVQPAPTPETVQPAPAPPVPASPTPVADVPAKKQGKLGVIIFIIIILLLLAGAAAGLIYFFTGDSYNIKKNLKLAEQCFSAEEYPEALEHYKAVLELDPTMTEIYAKAVDIYITDNAYEDAIDLLNKGLKKNKDEEAQKVLKDKLAEVYGKAADHYAGKKEFAAAYEMLQNGMDITGDESLKEKKAEYYIQEADAFLENGNLDQALRVLDTGMDDTGSRKLAEKQADIFNMQADAALEQNAYEDALVILEEGSRVTGEVTLQSRMSDIYKAWAEDYLPNKDYARAREILDRGLLQTGDTSLEAMKTELYLQETNDLLENTDALTALGFIEAIAESTGEKALADHAEYLRDHIKVESQTLCDKDYYVMTVSQAKYDEKGNLASEDIYDGEGVLKVHREFDPAKNVTDLVSYDAEGNISDAYKYEYEYDTEGNMTKRDSYDKDGNILAAVAWLYDEQGTQIAEISYDTDENVLYVKEQECVYNDKGELIEYAFYESKDLDDENKELIEQGSFSYDYDEQGNLARRVRYYEDGSIWEIEEYDPDGQILYHGLYRMGDSYFIGDGSEVQRITYSYDALGNMTQESGINYEEDTNYSLFYEYKYQYVGE